MVLKNNIKIHIIDVLIETSNVIYIIYMNNENIASSASCSFMSHVRRGDPDNNVTGHVMM